MEINMKSWPIMLFDHRFVKLNLTKRYESARTFATLQLIFIIDYMCSFSACCIAHTWLHISWALAGCLNVSWLIFDGEHLGTHAIIITQRNSQNDEDDSNAWSHRKSNNSLPFCKRSNKQNFYFVKAGNIGNTARWEVTPQYLTLLVPNAPKFWRRDFSQPFQS